MASSEELRGRWITEDGRATAQAVLEALRSDRRWNHVLAHFPYAHEVRHCADLRGLDFSAKMLPELVFVGAALDFANFADSDVRRAAFSGCSLLGTNMARVRADGAMFTDAQISDCDFSNASLAGADFSSARIVQSNFSDANMRRVGLRRCRFERCDLTTQSWTRQIATKQSSSSARCEAIQTRRLS